MTSIRACTESNNFSRPPTKLTQTAIQQTQAAMGRVNWQEVSMAEKSKWWVTISTQLKVTSTQVFRELVEFNYQTAAKISGIWTKFVHTKNSHGMHWLPMYYQYSINAFTWKLLVTQILQQFLNLWKMWGWNWKKEIPSKGMTTTSI